MSEKKIRAEKSRKETTTENQRRAEKAKEE